MDETKKRASGCEATRTPLKRSKPTAAVGVPGATGVLEAADAGSAFTWQSVQASAQRVTLNVIATAQLISAPSSTSPAPALPAEITQSLFRNARVIFLTSDEKSWVYHIPKWYRKVFEHTRQSTPSLNNADTSSSSNNNNMVTSLPHNAASAAYSNWLCCVWELHPEHHDAIKMFGRDVLIPRFQQVYGGDGYRFSGKSFAAQPIPSELAHCIETMQSMVVENTGDPGSSAPYLNGALVNWYANGKHYMGPHTDNEKELVVRSPVLSLSLGATRRFVFTANPKLSSLAPYVTCTERLELELGDGDLVIMGGTTQETHKHALPKMRKCLDKRVNVTLRCFKKKR